MTIYLAWMCNALLMQTDRGVFFWTHWTHPEGHVFRLATEKDLKETKWKDVVRV